MAVVSFTIPDAQIGRVLDAYCAIHGWRSVAEDGSRASFARAAIMRDIAGTVRAFERRAAEDAATAAVAAVTNVTIV